MFPCISKTKYFNSGIHNVIKNRNYTCSNCDTNQLIINEYLFSGYCDITGNNHNGCSPIYYATSLQQESYLKIIDKVAFICSNARCNKMSVNNLDGNPYFNISKLNSNELEILELLKINNKEILYNLLKEYFFTLSLNFNSAATLLARKMLMHFAFELGCTEKNKNFVYYVEFIKNDGTLGKKWNSKLDQIRKLGNEEAHEVKIASDEELKTIKIIMLELINSHFKPDII